MGATKSRAFAMAQLRLLSLVFDHHPFRRERDRLRQAYPEVIALGRWNGHWQIVRSCAESNTQAYSPTPERARSYLCEVERLTKSLGLDCSWGQEAIHRIVIVNDRSEIYGSASLRDPPFHFHFEFNPLEWYEPSPEGYKMAKERALEAFQRAFDEEWRRAGEALGQKPQRWPELKRQVDWLFRHTCLRKTYPQIASEVSLSEDAVKKGVQRMYGLMGIHPPKGRKPGFSRK